MSRAEPSMPLARLATWLPSLDRDAVRRRIGDAAVAAASRPGVALASRPRPLASQLVQAIVRDPAGGPYETSVGIGTGGEIACHCTCPDAAAAPPCIHVGAVLLALAAAPALREQIADDERPRGTVPRDAAEGTEGDRGRALALLRAQGVNGDTFARRRAPGLLDTTFQGWRRRGDLRPLDRPVFFLTAEPGDSESPDASPRLLVRVQPEGERRPFGPDDLESRRLPAAEWRVFEFLGRAPDLPRSFAARGRDATTFLDRAVAAGVDLRDDDGAPLAILAGEIRPALRLRGVAAGEVATHPVLAARAAESEDERQRVVTAWRRYREERGPIAWEDFLALVGPATGRAAADAERPDAEAGDALALEAIWTTSRVEAAGPPPASGAPDASDAPRTPEATAAGDELAAPLAESTVFSGPRTWVHLPARSALARVAADVGPIALSRLVAQPVVILPAGERGRLPALLREQFQGEGVRLPTREELGLPSLPTPRITLRLTGSPFVARAALEARYGDRVIALTPESAAHPDDPTRHAELEQSALDAVAATALGRSPVARRRRRAASPAPAEATEWAIEGDPAVAFWTRDLPRLVAACGPGSGIDEVVVPTALRQLAVRAPLRSTLTARAARRGLIDVALAYAADGVPAEVEEIRQALAAKRRWVRLTDGSVAELSERVALLASATQDAFKRATAIELSAHAMGDIEAWRSLADASDLDERVRAWAERIRAIGGEEAGPIPGLRAELRAYQRTGVAWLQLLADIGAGGILADDMGLGKTVQALALLAWRRHRDGPAPSLVVAPTSVALNWVREAERFVPDLQALLLHGVGRHERYDDVARSDLVVTTYALLRRDVARLRDIPFRYVVLDEAQQIKSHTAATTAAAKSLHAEARLALTGTPVENRLLELWSILDFCNPGMLGSWRSFASRYERPVAEAIHGAHGPDGDGVPPPGSNGAGAHTAAGAISTLRARIRPFVLRRTKADVQRDLPPKIESDVAVELTPAQRRAYAALAAAARADLAPVLAREGLERHRMRVLTALLRLRQMACDPRLVDPRHRPEDSAKLLALRELAAEVIGSGRRALVFSQFVELLTLVRRDLDAQGISYSYLDGRTRDRQAVIDGFVNGDDPLFLLSLRAGGTGINLAAADVVIHLDPWWNPAVEEQATDRAHRIGQTRTVSVYRIVAAGTIEEAIMQMKRRKRALASAVIDDDPGDRVPLTASEVDELLRFAE